MLLFSFLIGPGAQVTGYALPQPADDWLQDSTVDLSAVGLGDSGKQGDCHDAQNSYE